MTHTPGSGFIKVKNDSGEVADFLITPLTIRFAAKCIFPSDPGPKVKYFVNLIDPPNSNAYVFHPDTNFSNHSDRLSCLAVAIKDWVCLTAVNYKLGTDTVIARDSLTPSLNDTTNFNKDLISQFFCDTSKASSVPVGMYDLYHVLLHELGHGHSLNHVNDSTAVMWYLTNSNGISASQRCIKLYNDMSASDGGNYVVTRSLTFDTTNCHEAVMTVDTASNCSAFIGISELIQPDIKFIAYPNPANDFINISYSLENISNVEIIIYDYLGRIIYEKNKNRQLPNSYKERIDTEIFESGFYILKLFVNKFEYSRKMIKQ